MDRVPEDHLLLEVARLAMKASIRAAAEIGGMSPVQLRALSVIRDLEMSNLLDLAEGLGVSMSSTSRLVDRLVAQKLVDRRKSRSNRREISVQLSRRGLAVLKQYDAVRVREMQGTLEGLTPERRESLLTELRHWVGTAVPAVGAAESGSPASPVTAA